jgi:hypothetical protein
MLQIQQKYEIQTQKNDELLKMHRRIEEKLNVSF